MIKSVKAITRLSYICTPSQTLRDLFDCTTLETLGQKFNLPKLECDHCHHTILYYCILLLLVFTNNIS